MSLDCCCRKTLYDCVQLLYTCSGKLAPAPRSWTTPSQNGGNVRMKRCKMAPLNRLLIVVDWTRTGCHIQMLFCYRTYMHTQYRTIPLIFSSFFSSRFHSVIVVRFLTYWISLLTLTFESKFSMSPWWQARLSRHLLLALGSIPHDADVQLLHKISICSLWRHLHTHLQLRLVLL